MTTETPNIEKIKERIQKAYAIVQKLNETPESERTQHNIEYADVAMRMINKYLEQYKLGLAEILHHDKDTPINVVHRIVNLLRKKQNGQWQYGGDHNTFTIAGIAQDIGDYYKCEICTVKTRDSRNFALLYIVGKQELAEITEATFNYLLDTYILECEVKLKEAKKQGLIGRKSNGKTPSHIFRHSFLIGCRRGLRILIGELQTNTETALIPLTAILEQANSQYMMEKLNAGQDRGAKSVAQNGAGDLDENAYQYGVKTGRETTFKTGE